MEYKISKTFPLNWSSTTVRCPGMLAARPRRRRRGGWREGVVVDAGAKSQSTVNAFNANIQGGAER